MRIARDMPEHIERFIASAGFSRRHLRSASPAALPVEPLWSAPTSPQICGFLDAVEVNLIATLPLCQVQGINL